MSDIEQTTTDSRRSSDEPRRSTTVHGGAPEKGGRTDDVDLEEGDVAVEEERESSKVVVVVNSVTNNINNNNKVESHRDCRICHLSFDDDEEDGDGSNVENGRAIELGCCCKDDLGAAHQHCAELWFKLRGNKTCEICGSTAKNVVGVNEVELMEQWNDANDTASTAPVPPHPAETRHFWQGHKFLNFLLACMVFAFVISWLFHFNVPS
ncbi:hypothetical protein vseg_006653 [Gypsophila vaccaria]